jgi:hypothetical protein
MACRRPRRPVGCGSADGADARSEVAAHAEAGSSGGCEHHHRRRRRPARAAAAAGDGQVGSTGGTAELDTARVTALVLAAEIGLSSPPDAGGGGEAGRSRIDR